VPSKIIRKYAQTNLTVLRTRYQSDTAGKDVYDSARYPQNNDPSFDQVFGPLWRLFFRPSPAIASLLEVQLRSNGLVPGHYVSSHLRALYHTDTVPLEFIQRIAYHAVNCASMLRPGAPIFFASDSSNATQMVQTYASKKKAKLVVHIPNPNPPLHIDRDKDWRTRQPSDYFDTFVDVSFVCVCVFFSCGSALVAPVVATSCSAESLMLTPCASFVWVTWCFFYFFCCCCCCCCCCWSIAVSTGLGGMCRLYGGWVRSLGSID